VGLIAVFINFVAIKWYKKLGISNKTTKRFSGAPSKYITETISDTPGTANVDIQFNTTTGLC